jgi:lipopolysaccharide heptosyltransferase II
MPEHTHPTARAGPAPAVPSGVPPYDIRRPFETRLQEHLEGGAKSVAKRLIWLLVGAIGFLTRTRLSERPKLLPGNPDIRRILVVRVDLIGDVVLSLPAVRALKRAYPHAAIDMLVLKSSAGVLAAEGDVARVLTFDPYFWRKPLDALKPATWREARALFGALRAARYDLAISISGDIASILTRVTGARRRVGYAGEAYPFLLTDPIPGARYRVHQHEVRYVQALARAAGGIVVSGDELLALSVVPQSAADIDNRLRQARRRLGVQGPLVAIHVGARNGQAKRWPAQHIAALANRLAREQDALVVLTGAPNEEPLAHAVLRHADAPLLDLVGKTSVPELVAVLAASDQLVTGDSGPMHIACALRTPVVALHGPTDPDLSGPTAPDAMVLRRDLWCAPCYDASATAECRFGNPVCMKTLTPDLVFAAARAQLLRHGWELPRVARERPHVRLATHS